MNRHVATGSDVLDFELMNLHRPLSSLKSLTKRMDIFLFTLLFSEHVRCNLLKRCVLLCLSACVHGLDNVICLGLGFNF